MSAGAFECILESVKYKDWKFHVGSYQEYTGENMCDTRCYLQVQFKQDCTACGGKGTWKYVSDVKGGTSWASCDSCNGSGIMDCHGRKWMLSKHMTRSEIVQTALMAVLAAEEHEARENFKYMGQSIFDPHYNVNKLLNLRQDENALDKRIGIPLWPEVRK